MKFSVHMIADAELDLLEIYRYVALNDSRERADRLLEELENTILSLETFPMRSHVPPELERIGVMDYRETHYKSHRIVYEVRGGDVFVHCVLDGRRELQELLFKRMLRE